MSRIIKFRIWNNDKCEWANGIAMNSHDGQLITNHNQDFQLSQFTGLTDKNGREIYEGDIVEFTDKWEWYRGTYGIKMMFANMEEYAVLKAKYDAEPMHRFTLEFDPHEGYNLSRGDMQIYAVIGNIYENPDLIS